MVELTLKRGDQVLQKSVLQSDFEAYSQIKAIAPGKTK